MVADRRLLHIREREAAAGDSLALIRSVNNRVAGYPMLSTPSLACGGTTLDPGRCPPTSHEVDDYRNDGDDQEQVNKPPSSVKRKQT